MKKVFLHIDMNSYFATVEQQANPRLRGKPIGVTGGDRVKRTVLGAASVEAKKFGVKTGMQIWEAKKLCPEIILVPGDSDKYLETTKRFLNIIKDYSPYVEVFSIDEVFMQFTGYSEQFTDIAQEIKKRIKEEVGDYITCSIGISYNKIIAKLAGSLYKPDGLVMIEDEEAAMWILDRIELDEICGIGGRIKKRLNNMGIFNFAQLRKVPLSALLASYKSYGQILYNMSRGIDNSPVMPFYKQSLKTASESDAFKLVYEKEEVKSIGHRHTIDHDTDNPQEIKQILLKLTELVARRLRSKKLAGKTVHCWYREAFHLRGEEMRLHLGGVFTGDGMQITINPTRDGLEIFKAAWGIFCKIWDKSKIRMIGVSISNLKSLTPQNLSLLPEINRQEKIIKAVDKINNKYGEFSLQRGVLLGSQQIKRKPNPFLADRRFKI